MVGHNRLTMPEGAGKFFENTGVTEAYCPLAGPFVFCYLHPKPTVGAHTLICFGSSGTA